MKMPINDLTRKVLDGTSTKKSAKELAELFSTEAGQEYLSKFIDDEFTDAEILNIASAQSSEKQKTAVASDTLFLNVQKQIKQIQTRQRLGKIAIVILPLILIIGLVFHLNDQVHFFGDSELVEIYVPKGEKRQILFQDGSVVYLNADSKLRYPKQFSLLERKVYLEGEAYFTVSQNNNRPFIVQLKQASIRVLGTSFRVKSYANEACANVCVDEGKIHFTSTNYSETLVKGEQVFYNTKTEKCIVEHLANQPVNLFWKENSLLLEQQTLSNIITEISRYANIQFVILDPEILKYTYSISLKNTSIDHVLSCLEEINSLQFQKQGNKITITKKIIADSKQK